jgi:REP element-mobilizing transposase RayT
MDEYESLTKWECKCHVAFITNGRRKALYGEVRKYLEEVNLTRPKSSNQNVVLGVLVRNSLSATRS